MQLSAAVFLLYLVGFSALLLYNTKTMADDANQSSSPSEKTTTPSTQPSSAVYIVYTEPPPEGVDPDCHHLRTLASVFRSEEAAKDSLLYTYKTAATGFSAKLTPEQVSELSKKPGVLQVVPSRTLQLHSGAGSMNRRNV
ncbi:hypothetical protein Ancab_036640 [Ancistrocladus abbreviatus]